MGKIRCPLRPASMTLGRDRPEILTPPGTPAGLLHPADHHRHRPRSPPRPRQKHDYPSRPRTASSYARRTGAERTFATAKDPASNNIARGWTRLTGLTPLTLWLACLLDRPQPADPRPPGPPARKTTPAAPPPGLPPRRAGGAARPSPTWPQRAYHHDTAGEPAPVPASPQLRHPRASDPALKRPGTGTQARPNRQNPPTTANYAECQA